MTKAPKQEGETSSRYQEIEARIDEIRKALIAGEESGISELTLEGTRQKALKRLRENGKL